MAIKILISSEKLGERMKIRSYLKELPFEKYGDHVPLSISEEPPNNALIMFLLSRPPSGGFYDLIIANNLFGRVQPARIVDLMLSEKDVSSCVPFIVYNVPTGLVNTQKAALPENVFLVEDAFSDAAALKKNLEEFCGLLVGREEEARKKELESLMANVASGKKVVNFPAELERIYLASAERVQGYKKCAPWHFAPYLSLGRIYSGCNQYQTAIEYAKTAVSIDSSSSEAHKLLALAYRKTGRSFEEMETLLEMLRDNPESSAVLLKVGEAFLQKGNYREAERYFKDAIIHYRPDEEARSHARMHVGLGKTYVASAGNRKNETILQKAGEEFKLAINICPLLMSAYNDLIFVYRKLGQYDEASKIMALVVVVTPSTSEDWVSLFEIFLRDGDDKKAKVCLDKAIKFDPENQIILCLAAEAYLRQEMINDAISLLERAVTINPSDPRLYVLLGTCTGRIGRHQQAVGYFQKSLQLDPDDADAHYNLGNAYWNINEPALAKKEYEAALRLNPGMEEARVELGKFSGRNSAQIK